MQWHSQSSKSMQPLDLEFVALLNTEPLFQPQHLQTELHKGSKHFLFADHFVNFHNLSLENVWITLGENCCWPLLGLKRVNEGWSFLSGFNDRLTLEMSLVFG